MTGAGLGGTNRFYKVVGSSTWYFPLPEGLSGFVRGRFGIGNGYGGKELPASERFFLGGATTVRGFEFRDIGPQDANGNPLGGTSFLQFNLEVGRSFGRLLRLVAFFDAGNVYNPGNQFDFGDLRRSAGVGFRLITPVGPIRLDYGFKLDRRRGESLGAWVFSWAPSKRDVREEGVGCMTTGRVGWGGLWMGLLVVALGLGMARTAQAQKVGVVDLQAVLDQSVRGRAAKDRLRDLGDRLQHEIKGKLELKKQREEELQKLQTEFRTQKDLLTEQARAAKDEEYRRRARELKRFIDDTNRFTEDATQEFREREIRETQHLLLTVRKIVQEIGEREGYQLVFEGNENTAIVLYFNKAIDLTPKIVQRFDQAPPDQTLATPPAAPAPAPGKKR